MVDESFDQGFVWIQFYCPECHSKRRGFQH